MEIDTTYFTLSLSHTHKCVDSISNNKLSIEKEIALLLLFVCVHVKYFEMYFFHNIECRVWFFFFFSFIYYFNHLFIIYPRSIFVGCALFAHDTEPKWKELRREKNSRRRRRRSSEKVYIRYVNKCKYFIDKFRFFYVYNPITCRLHILTHTYYALNEKNNISYLYYFINENIWLFIFHKNAVFSSYIHIECARVCMRIWTLSFNVSMQQYKANKPRNDKKKYVCCTLYK